METINIIILVALFANIILVVFLWTLLSQSKQKIEDLSSLINKSIMNSEEAKKFILDSIEAQNKEIHRAIVESSQDTKIQFGYQRSFIEKHTEANRVDLAEVKDRLEYLSTEVNID
jgi:polyhydroxyalkanoate synthesis regulator phasin